MTAAGGGQPSFREVEDQIHALADAGTPAWRKHDAVRPEVLIRIPQIAESFESLGRVDDLESDTMWQVIEECIRAAVGKLRSQDFAPAALESFGMTALSAKLTNVQDRDERAARQIGPQGHGSRWYRAPHAPYAGMRPRHYVASQVAAALLGSPDPEQFVRDARARELTEPAPAEAADRFPNLVDLLDTLLLPAVPELVIAIARPIGTDTSSLLKRLRAELSAVGYLVAPVKLSGLIQAAAEAERQTRFSFATEYKRFRGLMEAGDHLRITHGDGAATAALAVKAISSRRGALQLEAEETKRRGIAYLVTNLMHPAEVTALRNTYQSRFFLIGVFEDDDVRKVNLRSRLKETGDQDDQPAERRATKLMDIDAGKLPSSKRLTDGSLSLNNTFHLADLFVSARGVRAERTIERFVQQVFSRPFGTLTAEETAMGIAYLAASRSSALARRVGAALVDPHGSVISVGWNDPVKKDGSTYTDDDEPDNREHQVGGDPSDPLRLDAIAYFLNRISDSATWDDLSLDEIDTDLRAQLAQFSERVRELPPVDESLIAALAMIPAVASTRLLNLIEFGRCVHAEMMAITDAAKRGVSTTGATLFVTTFPCHECARNIIAAGIHTVRFVEPYSKSLARKLYDYEATCHTAPPPRPTKPDATKVAFTPYEGFAPPAAERLFSWVPRKRNLKELAMDASLKPGAPVAWDPATSDLRDSVRGYPAEKGLALFFDAAIVLAEAALLARFPFTEQLSLA